MIGPLASIAGQGVHASFGVHTDMDASPNHGTASPKLCDRNQAKSCIDWNSRFDGGIQQSLAADGAIAFFSSNLCTSA